MSEAKIAASRSQMVPLGGAALSLLCAGIAAGVAAGPVSAALAVVFATFGLLAVYTTLLRKRPHVLSVVIDGVVIAAFVAGRDPGAKLWSLPGTWLDVLRLTPVGATFMVLLYIACALVAIGRLHRHLAPRESVAVLMVPVLFNLALTLGADGLTRGLGQIVTGHVGLSDWLAGGIGRAVILVAFVELLANTLRMLVAGTLTFDLRLHVVLIGSAIHAAFTPVIADLPQAVEHWAGAVVAFPAAIAGAALAQAGLWAIVYLMVGLTIDALHGTPPIPSTVRSHWRAGAVKGAIYGGVFVALLLIAEAVYKTPGLAATVRNVPVIAGAIGGALLFPLAQTIVGSADGTPRSSGA